MDRRKAGESKLVCPGPSKSVSVLSSTSSDSESDEDLQPLSPNPHFHTFVTKSALAPYYNMVIPVEGHSILPRCRISTRLEFRGFAWDLTYNGGGVQKRFDTFGWTRFAVDNCLRVDDGLIFEVIDVEVDLLTLKVRLLHGDYPPELASRLPSGSEENPIVLH